MTDGVRHVVGHALDGALINLHDQKVSALTPLLLDKAGLDDGEVILDVDAAAAPEKAFALRLRGRSPHMSVYQDQILPRVQDKVMRRKSMGEVRARVCAELHGEVVEVGFGTGLNARYYPSDVNRVFAVEPSSVCMHIAEPRIARSSIPVEQGGLTGERLDLPSEEFDAVLSTWTLCTIPNLSAALAEIRRVLKPGGSLHFVEHGHSPDPKVQRWQRRIEPLNKRLAGGCHLTRRIPELIEQAGFTIEQLNCYYFDGEPKPFGYTFEGRAVTC